MRKLILTILTLFLLTAQCFATNWKWIDSNAEQGLFFDTDSVKFLISSKTKTINHNEVVLWVKYVYDSAYAQRAFKRDDVQYSLERIAFNFQYNKVNEIEILPCTELIYNKDHVLNSLRTINDFSLIKDILDIENYTYTDRILKYVRYMYAETSSILDYSENKIIMYDNCDTLYENIMVCTVRKGSAVNKHQPKKACHKSQPQKQQVGFFEI